MMKKRIGSLDVSVFLPQTDEACPVIYVHASPEESQILWDSLPTPRPVLVCLSGEDWNRDLSPWPAPRVFRQGDDFAGGAAAYISFLQTKVIPEVEAALPMPMAFRGIAGYSLAGLFAVYAACSTGLFCAAASASGSLWFDGWQEWIASQKLSPELRFVSFSLGDKEKKTRNIRMATVETATLQTMECLQRKGIRTAWRLFPGGHFQDPTARLAHGIAALCGVACF